MTRNKRKQIIEVVPYNAKWNDMFIAEAVRLKSIFKDNFSDIHHIGSTAIPGMSAKPTIDILLEVEDINKVDNLNSKMEELGYEAWGEYNIPGRRFFVKGEDKRTHHVHTFQKNSPEIFRHLAFRNYLVATPEVANDYAELKVKLAEKFRNNRRAYIMGKQEFVKKIEQKALKLFK